MRLTELDLTRGDSTGLDRKSIMKEREFVTGIDNGEYIFFLLDSAV